MLALPHVPSWLLTALLSQRRHASWQHNGDVESWTLAAAWVFDSCLLRQGWGDAMPGEQLYGNRQGA